MLCRNMNTLVSFLLPLVSYIVIRPCNSCTVFHLLSDDTWQLSAGNGERKAGKRFSSVHVLSWYVKIFAFPHFHFHFPILISCFSFCSVAVSPTESDHGDGHADGHGLMESEPTTEQSIALLAKWISMCMNVRNTERN